MKYAMTLAAGIAAFLATAPAGWSQIAPDNNPKLTPTRSSTHPTSSESLAAQAQDLTEKINQARSQGKDTSIAASEQSQGEQAMQQGKEREALKHFQAGEQALDSDQRQ